MRHDSRLVWSAVLALGVLGLVIAVCSSPAHAAVRTVSIAPVSDLGLYGDASSGQERSNRGSGGRMDIGTIQSTLLKFDVQSVLAPDESVIGATLQLYTARQGYAFTQHVVAYPLALAWQEGAGNAGAVGDLGFPWGPVAIDDSVWLYRQATQVGLGTGSFTSTIVATDGVPWNVAGARGVGSDVLDRKMLDMDWAKPVLTEPVGTALQALPLTADGAAVLRGWSTTSLENFGMSIWATTATNYCAATSREFGTATARPQLVLTISLTGDVNADGPVDVVDLLTLAGTWAMVVGDAGYDANCDLNGDGAIDVVDLLLLASNWGR